MSDANDYLWDGTAGQWFRGGAHRKPQHPTAPAAPSPAPWPPTWPRAFPWPRASAGPKAYLSGALGAMLDLGQGGRAHGPRLRPPRPLVGGGGGVKSPHVNPRCLRQRGQEAYAGARPNQGGSSTMFSENLKAYRKAKGPHPGGAGHPAARGAADGVQVGEGPVRPRRRPASPPVRGSGGPRGPAAGVRGPSGGPRRPGGPSSWPGSTSSWPSKTAGPGGSGRSSPGSSSPSRCSSWCLQIPLNMVASSAYDSDAPAAGGHRPGGRRPYRR